MSNQAESHVTVHRMSAGNVCHLILSGVIDETFNPAEVSQQAVGQVLLDMGRIERISSFGVRRWVEFTSRLPNGTLGLHIIHAPPIIVDQLNMVEGFGGIAKTLSVLAPYSCATCGEDRLRLVDALSDAEAIAKAEAPPHSCSKCHTPLEFADQPAEFFDYLRHQKLGTLDPSVLRYLRTLQPTSSTEAATHLKIVQDDITFIRLAASLGPELNVRKLTAGLEGRVAFDFGAVVKVDPAATPKLLQILATANELAQLSLVRMTSPVLTALKAENATVPGVVASVRLKCICETCGSERFQRFGARRFAESLAKQERLTGDCPVCGGTARSQAMRELEPFFSKLKLGEPTEEFDGLEQRALSQYVSGTGTQDIQVRGGSDSNSDGQTLYPTPNFEILRRLGQGGMAEVFLARQVGVKGFEKYVVVKKVLAQFAESPEFVEMLFAEARANARLTHPNIVQTYDVGMMDGAAYLTMEYVRGPDVKKVLVGLRKLGIQLPIEHGLRIVAETAAGLHYAHSFVDPAGKPHPMVHRDVSPHNILVSLDGAVKLSDFGIAKVEGEQQHTRPGTLKGKIAYVSPEAISGAELDHRADVFSLGVVLYELLTGQLPFRRESEAATLRAIMRDTPTSPSQLNPAIPADVSALILRALEKEPSRRTSSAGVLRGEIEAALSHHRLNSSPFAVAQFLKDTLGQWLTDFTPTPGAETSLPPRRRSLSLPPAPPKAPSGSLPPFRPAPPVPDEDERTLLSPGPLEPPPSPAAAAFAARETKPVPPYESPPTRSGRASQRGLPPVPIAAGGADHPERGGPVLARTAAAERVAEEHPMPSLTRRSGSAAGRPSGSHVQSVRVEVRPDDSDGSPLSGGLWPPSRKVLTVGGVALAALVGLVVMFADRSPRYVDIENLEPGEALYVGGLRVDPARLPEQSGTSVMVATAKDGTIRRYGNAVLEGRVDLRGLADSADVAEEGLAGKGSVLVESDPTGCDVSVNGKTGTTTTPTRVDVAAGKETLVEVRCPSGQTWSRWVLAVGGDKPVTLRAVMR